MKKKRIFNLLATLLISVLILSACTDDGKDPDKSAKEEPGVVVETEDEKSEEKSEDKEESLEDSAQYLKEFFDLSFDDEVTKEDMNSALVKVYGEEAPLIEEELNGVTFIKAINEASGFKELSLTYSDEKAKKSLEKNSIDREVEGDQAKYLAATIDSGLIDLDTIKELVSADTMTHDLAVKSFIQVVNNSSLGRNYIGYSDDPDIYRKIEDTWDSFILFDNKDLTDIGAKLVKEEKITGYNLKLNAYMHDFMPEVTMSYGHSNIDHALQLIGLLNSEDLVAKVQLEPKISIYEYLPEWGDPGEPTVKYFVEDLGNILLANSVEYDLNLEFSSTEDLIKFEEIVDEYAKKNEENQGEGLIIESWWQPFLLVSNEEMPEDRFFEIYDLSISNDDYTLRTAVLKEDKDKIEDEFEKLTQDTSIKAEKKYTNKAFYDYLQGIDYQ